MQLKLNREMNPGETVLVITGPKEECDKILAEFQRVNREKKRRARKKAEENKDAASETT